MEEQSATATPSTASALAFRSPPRWPCVQRTTPRVQEGSPGVKHLEEFPPWPLRSRLQHCASGELGEPAATSNALSPPGQSERSMSNLWPLHPPRPPMICAAARREGTCRSDGESVGPEPTKTRANRPPAGFNLTPSHAEPSDNWSPLGRNVDSPSPVSHIRHNR